MVEQESVPGGSRDFDFFMGRWRVENKLLVGRLRGSTEWETFEAAVHAWPLPGGIGNYNEFVPEGWRLGYVGMALRIFNPETRLWSIYWVDNQTGVLQPPVVGRFKNGVGIFEEEDELDGRPILARFTWSDISRNGARWEQAFSPDNGKTWETNWVMVFTRVAD